MWRRRRLTPGLGSKVEWTRLPGRERSMSRSLHLSGSVGGAAAASGEAISPAPLDGEGICRRRGCGAHKGEKRGEEKKNPGP